MEKRGSKDKIFFLGFLLLVLVFLVIFTYVKDCGDDKACFADSASSCKKVKVVLESDSAVYSYEILGKKSEDCVILVTLNRITSQVEPKLKQQLEGKKMVCAVPKTEIGQEGLFNTKETSAYCTGPLREIFLQITIEKLYSFLVSTIGETAVQVTGVQNQTGLVSSALY